MKCKKAKELFLDYLDLNKDQKSSLNEHFRSCPACLKEFNDYQAALELLQNNLAFEPPQNYWEKFSLGSRRYSQIMDLNYVDSSYKKAAQIVNAVAGVFKEEIPTIMKVDNVTILSAAAVDENGTAINGNPIMSIIIAFLVSLVLGTLVALLIDYMDNTFKTEAEVEEELGLPVLAIVTKVKKVHGRQLLNTAKQEVEEGKYATLNQ